MKAYSDTEKKARLLVVDDHAFIRVGIKTILARDTALEVVGEAEDGEEALARCRELCPDVVLMDISMPKVDGIVATRSIKAEFPMVSVLMLTAHQNPGSLMEAVKAGAAGYVLKGSDPSHLLGCIRAVLEGETPLDSGLAMQLLRHIGAQTASVPAESQRETPSESMGAEFLGAPPEPLTPREAEVLGQLAQGKPNRQIAQELHVSHSTVKRHVEHIIFKLGVSDRTQAVIKALKLGMVPQ
jgi:two-component system response regulator DegU